ncbi:TPA: hypothetical protein JZG35_004567 [Escherichia coli]|nr:hypothetical protein [Escherichia coli]
MILSVFITVISGHDKPQPSGCLLERELATDEIALASLASTPVAWLVGGRLFTTEIAAGMYASEVRKAVKPLFFSALL